MNKKKVFLAIVLRALLAVLGALLGALITLILFKLFPSSQQIAPSLFVLNSGFFAAYCSSIRMKERILAPYFISMYVVISVIVCLRFYGMTWIAALNILGYLITIAGCVLWIVEIHLALKAAKKVQQGSGDQDENS